jgi:hypothetical protein
MRFRLSLLPLLIASPAAAAATNDQLCRNGLFAVQNPDFGLGKVIAGKRVFFVDDGERCPSTAPKCRLKSYLVPGDQVVIGRTRGQYLCTYYPKKGIAGWIDASRIRRLAVRSNPPPSAWLGRWSDFGNPAVRFYRRNGILIAYGTAAWPSFNPPRDVVPGGPHVGNLSEPVRTSGNRAYASECEVTFTLLGDFLVVADPKMQCGGANVSFSGVYRLLKP